MRRDHAQPGRAAQQGTFASQQEPREAAYPQVPEVLRRVLVLELALGDFLEGHRQVVLRPGFDERRRSRLESNPFTQLVVVVVDLASPLGGDDHECVARVDVLQQLIDAWMDHGRLMVPADCNSLWTMTWSSSAARSTSSLTIR